MATVSRCGMVWFSENVVTAEMLFERFLLQLRNTPLITDNQARSLEMQNICAEILTNHMAADGLIPLALNYAMEQLDHIMEPSKQRLLMAFFSMLNFSIKKMINYDAEHSDFPLSVSQFLRLFGIFFV